MKFIFQHDQMDCGPACLAMITSLYGTPYPIQVFRDECFLSKSGVSLQNIAFAAEKIGLEPYPVRLTIDELADINDPCILHWEQNHFVVFHASKISRISKKRTFVIADPAHGFTKIDETSFCKAWLQDAGNGVALFLDPNQDFKSYSTNIPSKPIKKLTNYLLSHKKSLLFLLLLLLIGAALSMLLPILTQKLMDLGVDQKNIDYVKYILLAQIGIFMGATSMEICRNWILVKLGARINITLITDYLEKLLKLPIRFFESKMIGDFTQRIQDNERIEAFLSSQGLLTVFSLLTFSAYGVMLFKYSPAILAFYCVLTISAVLWSYLFQNKRKKIDYVRFQQKSENQDAIFEIFNGLPDMKLNNYDGVKKNEIEENQRKLYKINIKALRIDQLQLLGFDLINQLKNIIILYLSARGVISGEMSIGEMMSVTFIIGQMNMPVGQLLEFGRSLQDAKLSIDRLSEINDHPEEESGTLSPSSPTSQPAEGIKLTDVSFGYGGPDAPYVLKNISLKIPSGSTTAIVGLSGSGKTTLLKMLLNIYPPTIGKIQINGYSMSALSMEKFRENCGIVMQDGYIFSESIARNIHMGMEFNEERLAYALETANLHAFVDSLPLKANTIVGAKGNGLSGGQRQRILIARAVYKNPAYLFFDEATSALDAENEQSIHNKLIKIFKGRTVVIIAHRLSTVKNANKIIVMNNGEIVEEGAHHQLIEKKGAYYCLVKNQLELVEN